ncbi:MAG: hypothetical protein HZA91_05535 [Verrucomicrobia bacterium]|nr:hypothetical protein [Verrucomicrobiota bacterium]
MKPLLKSHRSRAGQAMAEMVLALVAMVVIMVGIVTLGEGGYHQIASMLAALRDASTGAILGASSGETYPLVQDWDAGADNRNYTPDDRANYTSQASLYTTSRTALSQVGNGQPFDYPNYNLGIQQFDQHNLTTQIPNGAVTGGWSTPGIDTRDLTLGGIERGSERVEFGNALQRLVYDADKITIRNEVYWPQLSNLDQAP